MKKKLDFRIVYFICIFHNYAVGFLSKRMTESLVYLITGQLQTKGLSILRFQKYGTGIRHL